MSRRLRDRLADQQRVLAALEQTAASLERSTVPGILEDARQRVRTQSQRVAALAAEQTRFDDLQTLLGAAPAADLPVALLPVRLETRFLPSAGGFDFCVRVYPDDVHVDTHERELLEVELIYGRHFWEQQWRAAGNDARRKAAWGQLAQRFGPQRAAWIARATKPTNPTDRPGQPIADDQPLPVPPQLPTVPRGVQSWTRAPLVRTLPDRWVVFGYRNGERVLFTWGEPIPGDLAAGPAPDAPRQEVPPDQLPLDEGIRWLVDFDEAVRKGMALRVRLTAADAALGYDELVVVGLKASLDGASAAREIANLLDAQHYTDGLAFVPQGTPTNNTPGAASGFRSRDAGFEESYGAEIPSGDVPRDALDNAAVTARALGVDAAAFAQIVGAADREQADARAMHTALWPATWGYFLDQMLAETHTEAHTSVVRRLFIEHVRGRGPLPVLRIGRQPYGLLPASSLDRWKTDDGDAVRAGLLTLLRTLRERWRAALSRVPRIGRSTTAEGSDGDLLHLLAIEPVSLGFQARSAIDGILFGTPALPQVPGALPADITQRRQAVDEALAALGVTWQPRVRDFVFLSAAWPLTVPLVQDGSGNSLGTLAPDYIRWLSEENFATIRTETYPPGFVGPGVKLRSLLYLLLRHSTLLAYASVAHRILRSENSVVTPKRPEPTLIGILDTTGATGLSELDRQARSLRNAPVVNEIHHATAAQHPAAGELDELHAALVHLSGRRVADLERLLPEALDCCAHRLDAWITALAAERLSSLREKKPKGLLIGGYGWVQNVRPNTSRQPVQAPAGETGRMTKQAGTGGFVHAPSLNQAATAAVLRSGYLANRTGGPDQPFAIDLSSERVRRAEWLLDGVRQGQTLTALLGYRFERGLHEHHPTLQLDRFIERFRMLAPLGEIYQARGEKEVARSKADAAEASAGAKRAEGTRLVDQAARRLSQLQESKTRLASELQAAERDVVRFEEEIRKIQRPSGGGIPTPTPDTARRLAALREALAAAQRRVSSAKARLADLDAQINAATKQTVQASKDARQLEIDARALDAVVTAERLREQAADGREQELLARRRQALLLPQAAGTTTLESIAAQNVVDGLALHARYRKALDSDRSPRWDYDTIPFGTFGLPAANTPECTAIVAELRILDDSIDAAADAVMAESIHQTVLGNPIRAGASLGAVAGGDAPPPELEVVRTPRTGTAVTHRLVALLPTPPGESSTWRTDALQARALVEPGLDAWAALLLGDPRRILFRAEYVVDGAVTSAGEVSLQTVMLSPLDLLWMAGGARRAAADVLQQRLRYELLRRQPKGVSADAAVRLDFSRAESWGPETLSIDESLVVVRALAELVSSSRPLDSRDLEPSESAGASTLDVEELGARADRLVAAFEAAHARLEVVVKSPDVAADEIRSALVALTYFDVDAVPVNAVGESNAHRQALVEQAAAVHTDTAKRVRQLQSMAGADRALLGVAERLELESGRVAIVLGKGFRIVPRFKPANAAQLKPGWSSPDVLLAGDRLAPLTWLQQMARVRRNAAELNDVLTYTQCITPAVEPDLLVVQLPHDATDRWAALPFDRNPAHATLSLVLYAPAGASRTGPVELAGLLIDEWVDVVPGRAEQSGIAFNFDAPRSRPPQAILVAVAPGDQPHWDVETMETIVTETLELAKLRMVEVPQLDAQVSQFLPALYFGVNAADETISTDFRRAAAARTS